MNSCYVPELLDTIGSFNCDAVCWLRGKNWFSYIIPSYKDLNEPRLKKLSVLYERGNITFKYCFD